MNFQPSTINEFLATLPEALQIEGLGAIIEEHERWERGDLTDEEEKALEVAKELGKNMGETMERLFLK